MAVTWAQRPAHSRPTARGGIRADLIPSVGKDMGRLEPHCRSKHEPTLSHRAFKDGKGCHRAPSHSVSDTATCGYTVGRPAPAQIVIVQWARTIDHMHRTADSLGSGSGAAAKQRREVYHITMCAALLLAADAEMLNSSSSSSNPQSSPLWPSYLRPPVRLWLTSDPPPRAASSATPSSQSFP